MEKFKTCPSCSTLYSEELGHSCDTQLTSALAVQVGGGHNNGGSTDYYQLPKEAKEMQDLIEHREMNFAQGNMFKALYRANQNSHSSYERDLHKIVWYAKRELKRIEKDINGSN